VRDWLRFAVGVALGGGCVAAYLVVVGVDDVAGRATRVAPWALALVVALVAVEGLADALGVWASVRPLGDGLSGLRSVQFALAGDFFDTLSPAGPVSSEPILAQFIGTATATGYGDALGVRAAAKYVKSGAQMVVSTALAALLLAGAPDAGAILAVLGGVVALLAVGGLALVRSPGPVERALVAVLAPPFARLPRISRDRAAVASGVERFLGRLLLFRSRPRLVALIALGGVAEQVLAALALWVALAGTGTTVALLPLVAVVPLPQAASVVPVPASLGAYDGLLSGGLVLAVGVPAAAAAAAVLVVRTISLPFGLATGGVCVAFLRGWRPGGS
jgi:uncharacterized membrane protein YbhN (UPF0104 family)